MIHLKSIQNVTKNAKLLVCAFGAPKTGLKVLGVGSHGPSGKIAAGAHVHPSRYLVHRLAYFCVRRQGTRLCDYKMPIGLVKIPFVAKILEKLCRKPFFIATSCVC